MNAFVAGFIGLPQMNLIRLAMDDGCVRLGSETIKLPQALVQAAGERGAKEIIVGIRPEHVSVADESGEGIRGEVVLVESLGADSYVHAEIEGTDSSFVARTEGYDSRRPGSNVRLRIDPGRIFGFDAESEERLGDVSVDAQGTAPLTASTGAR